MPSSAVPSVTAVPGRMDLAPLGPPWASAGPSGNQMKREQALVRVHSPAGYSTPQVAAGWGDKERFVQGTD